MRKWVKKSLKEDDSHEEKTSSAREAVQDGEAVSSKTKVDTAPIQRYQTHTKECFDSYYLQWFYILNFMYVLLCMSHSSGLSVIRKQIWSDL